MTLVTQRFCRPLVLFALILFGLAIPLSPALQNGNRDDQAPEIVVKPKSSVFFAYGDTRFTDPSACELSDSDFRRALVQGMAHSTEKADFLIVTGDVVYRGDNDHDWSVFDEETKGLRDEKVPILPVLGNHDVHGVSGQSKFVEHFNQLKSYSQLKTVHLHALSRTKDAKAQRIRRKNEREIKALTERISTYAQALSDRRCCCWREGLSRTTRQSKHPDTISPQR
jgi:3',5'-cyclic AMP phosphodiesterase CpdA